MKTFNRSSVLGVLGVLATLSVSCSTSVLSPNRRSSSSAMDAKSTLKVERYVGSESGFKVTSNLILGESEAVLVDAQFTRSDARNVVKMIQESGRNLKTVFITHGHPDHYFGIETLKAAYPKAHFVASSDTIQDIAATGQGKLDYWKKLYGDELPDQVPSVQELKLEDLNLDGEQFELKSLLPGESAHASILVVPSLKSAFVGDMAYDEVHLWLAEAVGNTESWKRNLSMIERDERIKNIYVGHQKISRDNNLSILKTNRAYIDTALEIFAASSSKEEAATKLKSTFPTYSLPIIADLAAGAFVK